MWKSNMLSSLWVAKITFKNVVNLNENPVCRQYLFIKLQDQTAHPCHHLLHTSLQQNILLLLLSYLIHPHLYLKRKPQLSVPLEWTLFLLLWDTKHKRIFSKERFSSIAVIVFGNCARQIHHKNVIWAKFLMFRVRLRYTNVDL